MSAVLAAMSDASSEILLVAILVTSSKLQSSQMSGNVALYDTAKTFHFYRFLVRSSIRARD